MSVTSKFNALAAVKLMALSEDDDDDDNDDNINEIKEKDNPGSFLNAIEIENMMPLKSILKRKNIQSKVENESIVEESVLLDKKESKVSNPISLVQDKTSNSSSVANETRYILKLSGLPYDVKDTDVVGFLGVWPRDGYDGVKIISDLGGDPAGYAYIEVDAVKDMMHILESSGVKFKGKAISVSISSVNTMELEWASTQRVSKQIKKSPFVRLGNLPFSMTKQDVLHILSKYKRRSEDVYCWSDKLGEENSGYCYVIMNDCHQASKLCKSGLLWNNRKLIVRKVHPEILSQWCRRYNIQFVVRDSIKYDMSINDSFECSLYKEAAEDSDCNSVTETDFKKDITSDLTVNFANSNPLSSVFVYDPDNLDKIPSSEEQQQRNCLKEINSIVNDTSSNVVVYSEEIKEMDANRKRSNNKSSKESSFPTWSQPHFPSPFDSGAGRPTPTLGPREFPFRLQFQHGPFACPDFHFGPPGSLRPFMPKGMGPFPAVTTSSDIPNNWNADPQHLMSISRNPNCPPDFRGPPNRGLFNLNFADSLSLDKKDFSGPIPSSVPLETMRPFMIRPCGPPRLPFVGIPINRSPELMRPIRPPGFFVPRERSPEFMRPALPPWVRNEFVPTIYLRVYDVPSKATTDDVKKFFRPIIPIKISQNVGTDIYDLVFNNPNDAMAASRRSRASLCGKVVRIEMLPSPLVPLPQKIGSESDSTSKNDEDDKQEKIATLPDRTSRQGASSRGKSLPRKKESIAVPLFPQDPLHYQLKPFDPERPEGQCAIQPMEGYFCKICRKFYKSESTALVTHCKSKSHYDKVKAFMEEARLSRANAAGDSVKS